MSPTGAPSGRRAENEPGPDAVHPERLRALVTRTVERLGLDLRDLTVVTEAATGHFALTAVLAAWAGAARVITVARDSRHGTAVQAHAAVARWRKRLGAPDRVVPVERLDAAVLGQADLVTNLGWVRPLDAVKIRAMREGAAIAAMCEAWELRPGDIDRRACAARGVRVGAVNEDHPAVDVFEHNGLLAVKMLHALQIEVHGARIAVAGEGKFASRIAAALARLGAEVRRAPALAGDRAAWALENSDALIVADYTREDLMLGKRGELTVESLLKRAPHAAVVQFAGWVRAGELRAAGVPVFPEEEIGPRRMGRTMAFLGPAPVVGLHAAGLLAGAMLLGRPGPEGLLQRVQEIP